MKTIVAEKTTKLSKMWDSSEFDTGDITKDKKVSKLELEFASGSLE